MKSLLFVPGNNPSMLQNGFVFESDYIIIDLEDAVTVNEKDSARFLVEQFLLICDKLDKIIVRVNGVDTPFFELDMQMLQKFSIAGIMLPKIDLNVLAKFTSRFEQDLYPIIESCLAVIEMPEIIKHEQIKGVLLGAEDLTSDLEVSRTRNSMEILYPRQLLAYSAKAYGKIAIDTPTTAVNDDQYLREDCEFAKCLGFKAKACIHPNQVHIVNDVFALSLDEFLWAKRVLEAVKQNQSKGAFSLDGAMIDEPIIKKAQRFYDEGMKLYE